MESSNINLQHFFNAVTAFEFYASKRTFLEIFFYDTDRIDDLYSYFQKNKLASTYYTKFSKRERQVFDLVFRYILNCENYDEMAKYVQEI